MPKLRHRAFTLIELLIVVLIIGVLSSFVVSQVVGIQENVKRSQTQVQLQRYADLVAIYLNEYGRFPDFLSTNSVVELNSYTQQFIAMLDPYCRDLTLSSSEINKINPRKRAFYQFSRNDRGPESLQLMTTSGDTNIYIQVSKDKGLSIQGDYRRSNVAVYTLNSLGDLDVIAYGAL